MREVILPNAVHQKIDQYTRRMVECSQEYSTAQREFERASKRFESAKNELELVKQNLQHALDELVTK